jgi:DNA-directed RNA polymerase sigma subunit (sigma70/sigma32)
MAKPKQKNIVERLTGAGEEAIQRLGNTPGADKLAAALSALRDRVDEMQKSVRAIDKLEKRLGTIEQRLEKLEGKSASSRSRKTSSSSKRSATPRTPKT